jgi:flagellar motor switch protein FliM
MIDRMLGGSGRGVAVNRALTEIEQNVTDGVVKLILENLTETWRGVVDVQFRISGRETRPQMLQVAAPNEVVLLLGFEIRIGDTRGVLNVCIPATSIEAVSGSFTRSWQRTRREMRPAEHEALQDNVGRVTVGLEAGIQTTIGAGDFLKLQVGDVLSLDCPAGEPIEIRVNGKPKFAGSPTVVNNRAHIRLEPVAQPAAAVAGAA